jgi:hypothetical protein
MRAMEELGGGNEAREICDYYFRIRTQGFALVRQAFYHLIHTSSLRSL